MPDGRCAALAPGACVALACASGAAAAKGAASPQRRRPPGRREHRRGEPVLGAIAKPTSTIAAAQAARRAASCAWRCPGRHSSRTTRSTISARPLAYTDRLVGRRPGRRHHG